MLHKGYNKTYDFTNFKIICGFDAIKMVRLQYIWQKMSKIN